MTRAGRPPVLWGVLLASGFVARPATATLLWEGDANKGTGVFGDLQPVNGTISVVADPDMSKVFKIVCNDNGTTKARSEVSRVIARTVKTGTAMRGAR